MALLSSSGLNSTPTESTTVGVSSAAQPYASNVLAKGEAMINNPAPAYTGQLTAGTSALQNEAWQGLSNLTLPSDLTNAASGLQGISNKAQNLSYTGPTSTNQYGDTGDYRASNITNTYNPVTGTFDAAAAQKYMNPYLQQSLNPQLEEARRQAQITQMGNAAKATSQGAFGGSRAALMEAENNRNLGTNLANITGQGYNTAYQNAMNQYNADTNRQMTNAQLMAQYGMTAQQANEASRQFAQQQELANAQNRAQYGQLAQDANLKNAQFGATYGLEGLRAATTAGQAAANAGAQEAQYGLENLKALATVGNTQQAQDQAALNAQYNQYLDQRNYPWTQLSNQSALIKNLGGTETNKYGAEQSTLQKAAGITATGAELMKNMKASGLSDASIANALKSIGINPDTLSYTGSPEGLNNSNIDYNFLRNMDDTQDTYRDKDGNLIGEGE